MPAPDLSAAANPDWAADALRRLASESPEAVERLASSDRLAHIYAVVVGASEALGHLIARNPSLLDVLDGDAPDHVPPAVDADAVAARAVSAADAADDAGADGPSTRAALVSVQRAGLLQIAARDMLGARETDGIAAELAALAQGMLRAALELAERADATADTRLLIIGMGKLGGRELNYVSDIDVLFVHDGDTDAALRQARTVLALLGGHSPLGQAYEVDANLRPEGRNGPLSKTLDSYVSYWDRWAKTWEFQALMKSNPMAGPSDLAEGFSDAADRFIWPDALGGDAVDEIQAMKGRVERSKPVAKDGERQLKLAPGGLRDIEFTTQLLQLVHGPMDSHLRVRGTVPGLRALSEGGYVDDGDAALFTDAYLFLRTVEHRLQLRSLRRTHTIPADADDLQRLARAMGFRDLPVRTAAESFTNELARVRSGVRRVHQELFYRPLLSTIASYSGDERGVAHGRLNADAVDVRLRSLSFHTPGKARRDIEAMARGSTRSARQLRVILPTMLEVLAEQPDPDGGLAALRDVAEHLSTNPRFVRVVRDNPPAARLLARALGRSPRLAEWLSRQPDVLALFDDADDLARPQTAEHYLALVEGLLRRGGGKAARDSLRRVKRRESLRVALRDVLGVADVRQVGSELTWLGEALVRAGLRSVADDRVRLAVIGMGRFGAAELAHASDLDVIVVHDGPTEVALDVVGEWLAFLADVTPEKKAFRIDMDLRPEGRGGPLSRTIESHTAYYERWSEPWELQALTQARVVAGDEALGQAFLDAVAPRVYPTPVPADRLLAIRKMKARIEAERAGRPKLSATGRRRPRPSRSEPSSVPDLKLGPGGLTDVEWTAQLLQIAHGGRLPELRGPGTIAALERLSHAGLLSSEEAGWLREGWELLSRVRNALYLMRIRDTSTMPADPGVQTRLARLLGYESSQQLTEEADRSRRRIRKVFDRRFYG